MRLASAFLLSAGAHFTALSVAGGLPGLPATAASGEPAVPTPLRVALAPVRSAAKRPEPRRKAAASQRYLSPGELDVRPQIKTQVMPRYPETVLPGTRGRVVLELLIATDGSVDGVNVERAEPGGLFEEAAVKAFSQARFSPGMKRGLPVRSLVRVEVTFGD